jgi:hypothetical protein
MAEIFNINEYRGEPKKKKPKEDQPLTVSNIHTYSEEISKVDAEEAYEKSSTPLSKKNFIRLFIFNKKINRNSGGFSEKDFYKYTKELEKETMEQLEKKLENPVDADFYSRPSFTLALIRVLEKKTKEKFTK